ncbi:MAG: hypothetical protein PWQ97_663 [Tepidanaerobacteraceae bacterium]|nr:hypothetical protein [Tepidanaerobacteraceae bacterium]
MERIQTLLRQYEKKLLSLDNVVGVGMGYKIVRGRVTNKPAVMVLVKKKYPEGQLKSKHVVPKALNEVPTDVIEVGEIRLLSTRTERARPAQPGMSIGHFKVTAGTFGAVVMDVETGEPLILSNNHVLANATDGKDGRSAVGDPILQPGVYDGGTMSDVIANLERFVPIAKSSSAAHCPIARGIEKAANTILKVLKPKYRLQFVKNSHSYNLIDAAVAKPVRPGYILQDIFDLGRIRGTVEPRIGMKVKKSGRTSGITESSIKALDVILKVMLGPSEEASFCEQILTGPMAQPGDSGSIVVDENMNAVGLLFAGSDQATIINPIANVMKLLKVTF